MNPTAMCQASMLIVAKNVLPTPYITIMLHHHGINTAMRMYNAEQSN